MLLSNTFLASANEISQRIFNKGEVIIGEYSPIITEPEANNCFSINTKVIISTRNHLHLQWQNDYWQPFCPSR